MKAHKETHSFIHVSGKKHVHEYELRKNKQKITEAKVLFI